MNKLLAIAIAIAATVTGSANAADLKGPPQIGAPVVYNWSGYYLGGNLGATWSDAVADPSSFTTTGVDFAGRQGVGQFPSFRTGDTGFTGGVQTGYNWQFAPNMVAGIEADFNYSGLNKTDSRAFAQTAFGGGGLIDANTESATQRLSWLGTVRGRLGLTFLDNRLLAFATGGFAYGRVTDSIQTIGVPNGAAGILVGASSNTVRTGWTLGGGIEYAFLANWSAKLEYLYYDLGSRTLNLNYGIIPGNAGNTFNYKFHDNGNLARAGVSYHF